VPRWLLVLFTALTLVGSSVTSWAAAVLRGESECCCPVKAECRCHDHDGPPTHEPVLKKCGGRAELVAPVHLHAVPPPAAALAAPVRTELAPRPAPHPLLSLCPREPETPPF
jgi:hypothetical protein